MSAVVIGINNQSMPLELFERLALDDTRRFKALAELSGPDGLDEVAVLATCNRTEIYTLDQPGRDVAASVGAFLLNLGELPRSALAQHLYVHRDQNAVRHLFRVAAGLDSAVVGETEILGQVRTARRLASQEGASGPALDRLFRHAVQTGKRARSETAIARGTTSMSQAAIELAVSRLGGLADRRALILGAGAMATGMAMALRRAGIQEVLVANRTWTAATDLASSVGGRAVRSTDIADHLTNLDLVLSSTGSNFALLEPQDVAPAVVGRDQKPLLLIDLGVPRDIDPKVGELPEVTLLDMEDVQRFARASLDRRHGEVAAVNKVIDQEMQRFESASSSLDAAPLIASLHSRAEDVRASELLRFQSRLANLDPQQLSTVEELTRAIVNKLLHAPTVAVKNAAGSSNGDALAEALRLLHDLQDRPHP